MEPPLSVEAILRELDDLGCAVLVKDGQPQVTQPKDKTNNKRFHALLRSLRAQRDAVLAHFQGTPEQPGAGAFCSECNGTVFVDDPAVQQMCHQLMCPFWKSGTGPEWLAKERNEERWRRGKKS